MSLVSITTLGVWDPRRFRPNIVLEGHDEDALVGRQVRIGGVSLEVTKQIDRCVMVTRAQPGVEADLEVLRTINRAGAAAAAVAVSGPDGRSGGADGTRDTSPDGAQLGIWEARSEGFEPPTF